MLYRSSSFRKTAITLTTTAAMLAGASLFAATQPASAQQVSSNAGSPACVQITDAAATIKCEFNQSVLRTEQSAVRTKAATERGAAADDAIACLTDLKKFKDKNPDGFTKLGPITRETACSAAAKIPRPTASLN